jgi:hypothetical protein
MANIDTKASWKGGRPERGNTCSTSTAVAQCNFVKRRTCSIAREDQHYPEIICGVMVSQIGPRSTFFVKRTLFVPIH